MTQKTVTETPAASAGNWYIAWGMGGPGPLRLVKAHIRESRPTTRLWMDILLPLSAAAVVTGGAVPWRPVLLFAAAMVFLHYAATLLNDLQDAETDRLSDEVLRSTRPIAVGTISPRLAIAEIGIFLAVGLAAATIASWELGLACAILILLVSQHELPPLRTQSRPVFSPIAGLIGLTGIAFCICLAVRTVPGWPGLLYLAFVVVYLGAGEMLVKDVRDVSNDARGGKQTTSVRYGAGRSARIAVSAYFLATLCYTGSALAEAARGRFTAGISLLAGTAVLVIWTVVAARVSARFASVGPAAGKLLHRGSVTAFSAVSVIVLVLQLAL